MPRWPEAPERENVTMDCEPQPRSSAQKLTIWRSAPTDLKLCEDEVHVWRLDLERETGLLEQLASTLSAEEKARQGRFHFEKDRRRFGGTRGALRTILGRYLGIMPTEIRFACNAHGKPELEPLMKRPDLRFNVTHSHGLALLAFNLGRDIGIDVEFIRCGFATEPIAERFFAPAEVEVLRSCAAEVRARAFFNCWTRKEAFVKARGLGLSLSLNSFVVVLRPGEPPGIISVKDDPKAASRWIIKELDAGDEYAAALAVEGGGWEMKCFPFA